MKNLIFILFLFVFAVPTHGQTETPFRSDDTSRVPPPPPVPVFAETEAPFTYVENMPSFPGGPEAMYKFIYDNIIYPDSCKSVKTEMHVLQFVVDTTGYLVNPKVVRGHPCGFKESLRIISLMNEMGQRWSPGSHNGRKVSVTFTLPIRFIPAKD